MPRNSGCRKLRARPRPGCNTSLSTVRVTANKNRSATSTLAFSRYQRNCRSKSPLKESDRRCERFIPSGALRDQLSLGPQSHVVPLLTMVRVVRARLSTVQRPTPDRRLRRRQSCLAARMNRIASGRRARRLRSVCCSTNFTGLSRHSPINVARTLHHREASRWFAT